MTTTATGPQSFRIERKWKMNRYITRALGVLAAALTLVVGFGVPADASSKVIGNPSYYDMRGFVGTPGLVALCQAGAIAVPAVTVKAPAGGAHIYETVYIKYWDASAQQWKQAQYGNASPLPGGVSLGAGNTYTIPNHRWVFGSAGYYYVEIRVDFQTTGNHWSTVWIEPTAPYDYTAQYQSWRFQGNGYSYCYRT
jgi:hypothetical protein